MESQKFVTIMEWQRNLGLKGNDLFAFAIVWGFAQETGIYTGSASYIAYWLGCTKRNAINILNKLSKRDLIVKVTCPSNGVDTSTYAVNITKIISARSSEKIDSSEKSSVVKKVRVGSEKISLKNNIDIYNTSSLNARARGIFEKPSVAEVRDYCQQRGNQVDPEAFVDFYESKGWKVGAQPMKDWRAAIRTWEKRDNYSAPSRRPAKPSRPRDKFSEMMEVGRQLFGGGQPQPLKPDTDEQ